MHGLAIDSGLVWLKGHIMPYKLYCRCTVCAIIAKGACHDKHPRSHPPPQLCTWVSNPSSPLLSHDYMRYSKKSDKYTCTYTWMEPMQIADQQKRGMSRDMESLLMLIDTCTVQITEKVNITHERSACILAMNRLFHYLKIRCQYIISACVVVILAWFTTLANTLYSTDSILGINIKIMRI